MKATPPGIEPAYLRHVNLPAGRSQRLAAIDIGTNTSRLLIAKVYKKNNFTISEIHSERVITRLGKGISRNGLIMKESMNRGLAAFKNFSNILSRYHVFKTSAVATSALREAKNSSDFIKRVKDKTGIKVRIISGKEEARKTFSGMLIGIKQPKSALMVDIGGGSTEIIFTKRTGPALFRSLNLGVVYLAEKHLRNDPPSDKDLKKMEEEISKAISSIYRPLTKSFTNETVFIGTAGTVTALAAMKQGLTKYNHSKIHNTKLTINDIRKIFSVLSAITIKERAKYFPFEPARLDIIVPGTLILLKLMEIFGFKKIIVSDYGLREGILLDLYRKSLKKSKRDRLS